MSQMSTCSSCGGFVTRAAARCPHCDSIRALGALKIAGTLLGSSAIAVTLMACYGGPPQPPTEPIRNTSQPATVPPPQEDAGAPIAK